MSLPRDALRHTDHHVLVQRGQKAVGVPADVRVDQLRELPAGDIVGLAAGRVGVDDGRGGLRAVGVGICFASMPAANAPNRFIVKPLSQVGHLYCFKDTVMSLYAVPSS